MISLTPYSSQTGFTFANVPVNSTKDCPDLLSTVWKKVGKETIKIVYSEVTGFVSAYVHKNGRKIPLKSENLPREFKQATNGAQLRWVLEDAYVRTVTLSNGDPKLHLQGRIHGGAEIEEAIANLKDHFANMPNPFLVATLRQRFEERLKGWGVDKGLEGWMDGLHINKKTKRLLTEFSNQICYQAGRRPEQRKAGLVGLLKRDFFSCIPWPESPWPDELLQRWPNLKTLLEIPQIQELSHDRSGKVIRELKLAGDSSNLTNLLSDWIDARIFNSIRAYVTEDGEQVEVDLPTLLDEVIRTRPKEDTSLLRYRNTDQSFFINKLLQIKDGGQSLLTGNIIDASKSPTGWCFWLEDHSEVKISNDFKVVHYKKDNYGLIQALISRIVTKEKQDLFELEDRTNNHIPRGNYKIGAFKFVDNRQAHHLEVRIDSVSQPLSYTLRIRWPHNLPRDANGLLQYSVDQITSIDASTHDASGRQSRVVSNVAFWKKECRVVIVNEDRSSFSRIGSHNARDCILIHETEDEKDRKRIFMLAEIDKEIHNLAATLKGDDVLLDSLVDNWISHKLLKIDAELINSTPLELEINKINSKYASLQINKSSAEILLQIIEEANYSKRVNKQNDAQIAQTMELLKGAFEHAENVIGKSGILFVGTTGSGKSTTICHLMKVPLETFTNSIGQNVYKVGADQIVPLGYPVIGQGYGTSETLYSQGYSLQERGASVIVDTAGFDDTRGPGHELCAALSMELIMNKLHNVHALVVVTTLNTLIDSKGNAFTNLMYSIRNRFPVIFDAEHPNFKRLFFLITKSEHVSSNLGNIVKLEEHLRGLCQEQMKSIEKDRGDGIDCSLKLAKLQFYERMIQLTCEGRLHYVKPTNTLDPGRLIRQFTSSATQLEFTSAMDTYEMKEQFGNHVSHAVHTWKKVIFEHYLDEMPRAIAEQKEELIRLVDELAVDDFELRIKLEDRNLIENRILQLTPIIHSGVLSLEDLDPDVYDLVIAIHEQASGQFSELRDRTEAKTIELTGRKQGLENLITIQQGMQNQLKEQIQVLERDIKKLKEGNTVQRLFEQRYNWGQIIHNCPYYLPGARDRTFNEVRAADQRDFVPGPAPSVGPLGQWCGQLCVDPLIEREFRLVPSDPVQQQQFEAEGRGGKYKAQLNGVHYQFEKARTEEQGMKIKYGITLNFVPGQMELPWISIEHIIPNEDYNNVRIINLETDIGLAYDKLTKLIASQANKKARIEAIVKQIQELECWLHREQVRSTGRVFCHLNDFLENENNQLDSLDKEIKKLKESVAEKPRQVEDCKQKLFQMQLDKRRFAAAIYNHQKSARPLAEFAELIATRPRGGAQGPREVELVRACQDFINIYRDRMQELVQECLRDLGLD